MDTNGKKIYGLGYAATEADIKTLTATSINLFSSSELACIPNIRWLTPEAMAGLNFANIAGIGAYNFWYCFTGDQIAKISAEAFAG